MKGTMNGYNALAGFIGTYPSLAVFRRFLILNARNLLCMQGEIINFEHGLRVTIKKDRESGDPVRSLFEYDISALSGRHATPGDGVQWSRTLELRRLLKDYNEALLQFAALCRLAPANKSDLATVRELLQKPDGSREPFLVAHEFETWDEEYEQDLTSLAGQHTDKDALSKFIDKMLTSVYTPHLGRKYHDPLSVVEAWAGHGVRRPLIHYPDKYVANTIDTLTTILSSALPTLSALAIFTIHDPTSRMIAIVVCTLLFSTVLSLTAKPRRVETFCASAAFAAVLVVFVSGSNSSVC
ncbi:uncharacterized protein Z518_03100 [Rhinocladiella mackenziei CBS 650.93]|uniref:DUF6594 domain-containing protein n=1 Tax=Rhinocladiella mackenziei CBS 650.93 TaxID=1442369 RepID=A0A0D2IR50_9EURO|nr:uncharacterized protein Z518_03100 [Rhinocladiella mackenziei CBS 650.93]KIX08444.1 hypothetical protein Z518_03100 [Rhinocladiella mackenziei CBS 650.93]